MTVIEQTAPILKPREKSRAWRKMKANRGSLVGLVIIAFFAILAITAPILPIPDPVATSWGRRTMSRVRARSVLAMSTS